MLGIVVLNYNTWRESIVCCESIIKHTKSQFRIYLVDNCSPVKPSENQLSIIDKLGVVLIMHNNNLGYAAGNNIGLKRAYQDGCDFYLICNSDVIFNDNSIDRMLVFLSENKNAGIVGPLIYDLYGNRQQINMLCKLSSFGKIKNMLLKTPFRVLCKRFENRFIFYNIPTEPLKVFGVSGCCFLFTKSCYESVFPFDEHTFLYEEEYILGCRLEKAGIEAFVIPDAHVVHAEGLSTRGMNLFSYNCLITSEQYYMREYLKASFIMRYIVFIIRKMTCFIRYHKTTIR